MKTLILQPEEARNLVLANQWLCKPNKLKGKDGVRQIIQQLGYVQIDTISVVERAHHHVLWSRQADYEKTLLDQLLRERKIFEYWSHAAAFLPMEDFRFSLFRKERYRSGEAHWFERDKKVEKYVLDRIKAEGPLSSKDFEHKRQTPANWYEWKPAKKALEQLFMQGSLMVSERRGFQKVYDLTERVLPAGLNTTMPSRQEMANYLIKRAVQSLGPVAIEEMAHLRKGIKEDLKSEAANLVAGGGLLPVKIKGIENRVYYLFPEQMKNLESLKFSNKQAFILSPFDNLVIQRRRLSELFDFDYTIECYVPAARRQHGYFVLPVMFGNRFVARIDAKADRKSGKLFLLSLHYEKSPPAGVSFYRSFAKKLRDFAAFCGCGDLVPGNHDPALNSVLRAGR